MEEATCLSEANNLTQVPAAIGGQSQRSNVVLSVPNPTPQREGVEPEEVGVGRLARWRGR